MISWWSMLRTIRAAAAVLLLGWVALTVPPQTRDMLTFLDTGHMWPAVSFQIALIVLGGSAWFWSRAALAARFGINDHLNPGSNPGFNGTAYTWLPRFLLIGTFLVGAIIAAIGRNPWTTTGAIILGLLAALLAVFRPAAPPSLFCQCPARGSECGLGMAHEPDYTRCYIERLLAWPRR
jgi:hypothetical protein